MKISDEIFRTTYLIQFATLHHKWDRWSARPRHGPLMGDVHGATGVCGRSGAMGTLYAKGNNADLGHDSSANPLAA